MKLEKQAARRTGRPLSFDPDAALETAMLLFWRHGYETTSVSDLTAAMGITPPSLYTAFGDKRQLFLETVRRYLSNGPSVADFVAQAATAREAAWGMLQGSVILYTGEATPPGCLLASAAITGSAAASDVRGALAAIRRETEGHLRRKIDAARETGELPRATDADALAGHVMAVIQGLSTLARDGASREKLMRVATTAMLAWPTPLCQI